MATFTASAAQANVSAFYRENGTVTRVVSKSAGGTAISAGDVWQMVKVPNGATIVDWYVVVAAGTSSLTLNLGDGNSTGRYVTSQSMTAASVVRAGGGTVAALTGFGYSYSAEDTIDVVFGSVGSAGDTTSLVTVGVTYTNGNTNGS